MQDKSEMAAEIAINETRKQMQKAGFTEFKVAKELKIIAFSDIADHCTIDEGGALQMIPLSELGQKSRAIKKVRENTKITESKDGEKLYKDSRVEYELYDKLDALKFAATLMGMKPSEKLAVEHDFAEGIPARILAEVEKLRDYAHQD